ncbi:MAG: type I restriction enzyme HsdR N-terminal domain-containing protein [Dehalococcoidia bacterium]
MTDFLCDGLGFDKYADLTTEYQVRGEFADYGVRVEKQLTAFIEVKRISTKLGPRHLRQVEMYAVNEGVEWMILTNGAVWQVWHLSPGMPVTIDLVIETDLLSSATPQQKTSELFYLTIEALKRKQIDELWKARSATSPKALAAVLRSENVLEAVRRELRRASGHRIEAPELLRLLNDTVIRADIG